MAMIVQNGGSEAIQVGDVVAAVGIADTIPGLDGRPNMVVRRATSGDSVIGVVQTAMEIDMDVERIVTEDEVIEEPLPIHTILDGPVKPGEFMMVLTQGLAQVRVDASAEVIKAGADLAFASETGFLATASLDANRTASGIIVGTALETMAEGTGLVWAYVDIR